ncbi:MAG: aminodeoxychorismate/anthranilate synthase component II [Micromonosporaceae bacterium]|nr:aminodeoxychorismate/anthranilate synthase component II [Micromonosporaceae bacterium]
MRVLVIDNYDSFVYNLVQYLGQLDVTCDVRRNDEISVEDVATLEPDGVLLSPGPGTPDRAGICLGVVKRYAGQVPIFGVCLGHQAIGAAFGATVARAPELLHGKTSEVIHSGVGVLSGLPSPFTATRYHSLAVLESTIPPELEVTGRTENGIVMAMRHRELPIEGVQFHPESVLTQGGHLMLANWLAVCGYRRGLELAEALRR